VIGKGDRVRRDDGLIHEVHETHSGVTGDGTLDLYSYSTLCDADDEYCHIPFEEAVVPVKGCVTCMACVANNQGGEDP